MKRMRRISLVVIASLLVAVVACRSTARLVTTPPPHGSFVASSECVGTSIVFTLHNLDNLTSIRVHENSFVILDQSHNVVYQPVPGSLSDVAVWSQPPNVKQWIWNQHDKSGVQVVPGTYVVVLAVEDDAYDSKLDADSDPWQYVATFKISPLGPLAACA